MKSKLVTFLLFIIMLVLFAGLIIFAYAIYVDLFDAGAVQTVHTEGNLVAVDDGSGTISSSEKKNLGDTIKEIFTITENDEELSYSDEKSTGKHFYEQLSERQKILYNGLQENKENLRKGTYQIKYGNKFADLLANENGSDILGDDYQTAIEAFTHDNADLFFLDVSKMYLNIESKKKLFNTTYNVYINPGEGKNYYAKGFNSEEQVLAALRKIDQVKEYIKSKLTGNAYKDTKLIHDYLVNNIQYDEHYESIGSYTIYGALVEEKCVCEGYARAFKYLADMAGIPNVLMQGTATNTEGKTENHAWNAVKIKGQWYLLDTTWDDPIIVGKGVILSSIHYKYFLKGSKNFNEDHKLNTQFTEGGKQFNYPTISASDY